MLSAMDVVKLGLDVRVLRVQRRWTQRRLAAEAGISASALSLIERGRADRLTLATLGKVVDALDARLSIRIFWQGEGLDRLRDRRHARIVEQASQRLLKAGWDFRPEVSFSEYGERGSIDLMAFHTGTGALLVIEVKSVVPDLQAMLSALDRKARLAAGIGRSLGWQPRIVSRLLILPDDRTARRRVAMHATTFQAVLPARTATVNRWLRDPAGPIAGILFLSDSNLDGRRQLAEGCRRR